MKTIDAPQGSPGWHAHRATARNASEAPAVLGCSPYTTRAQMLHARHTGIRPEVTAQEQARFDAGHAIEAAQMAGAEAVIGEPLFPVVGSAVVDGIELSASFDGLTMDESTAYECKTSNDALRAVLAAGGDPDGNDGRALPKHYRAQMEQQLAVCGGERVLFVAADRDGADVRRCWYYPDMELRAEILAAWRQFDADLATYTPPAASAVEKIVAEPVEMLPAPVVQVSGALALQDNFQAFEQRLRAFLADTLIREPKTDQDFADLDAQIKVMKDARDKLKQAEAQMLAQVQPIDQAKRTKDMLDKLLQQNVSMAEKILTDEKERRKGEIVAGAVTALREHVAGLNKRLGQPFMPATASAADFGGCIKGLRSLASMEDKIATALANAKIEASAVADKIQANLQALPGLVGDRVGLTADIATLVLKEPGDFAAVVSQRVQAQREQEERRAAELAERERERIRREEAARVEREAQERAAAERAAQAAVVPPAPAPTYPPAAPSQVYATGPVNVVPMPTKAPAATATLIKLGAINERIAPLSITADGLASLGFSWVATDKASKLYRESDFGAICKALIEHIESATSLAA